MSGLNAMIVRRRRRFTNPVLTTCRNRRGWGRNVTCATTTLWRRNVIDQYQLFVVALVFPPVVIQGRQDLRLGHPLPGVVVEHPELFVWPVEQTVSGPRWNLSVVPDASEPCKHVIPPLGVSSRRFQSRGRRRVFASASSGADPAFPLWKRHLPFPKSY